MEAARYFQSEKGKATKRRWAEDHKDEVRAHRRRQLATGAYAVDPEHQRARMLIRNAVRRGLIAKPEGTKSNPWFQRWEFHHPDHTRPYYGVWLLNSDHKKVEKGLMECPPCTDYSDAIRTAILREWDLT
jgi:hypothetical protein